MFHLDRHEGQKLLFHIAPSDKPTTIALEVSHLTPTTVRLSLDLPRAVTIGRPDSQHFLNSSFYLAATESNALTFTEAR